MRKPITPVACCALRALTVAVAAIQAIRGSRFCHQSVGAAVQVLVQRAHTLRQNILEQRRIGKEADAFDRLRIEAYTLGGYADEVEALVEMAVRLASCIGDEGYCSYITEAEAAKGVGNRLKAEAQKLYAQANEFGVYTRLAARAS